MVLDYTVIIHNCIIGIYFLKIINLISQSHTPWSQCFNNCKPTEKNLLDLAWLNRFLLYDFEFNLECASVSFSKSWNCTSPFGECNFSLNFWKTHKSKLIPNWTRKTVWLLIIQTCIKIWVEQVWKISLEVIFSHPRKLFSKFPRKIFLIILRNIIY